MGSPNILLVLSDQQRGDCLGIEDHPVLQTPNLDFLADAGTRFRRAYSECPSCIPARRTIMSGQSPAVNGMVGMIGGTEWMPTNTLAGELSRAGYQCAMVGKLHLWPQRKRYGFHQMLLADSTRGSDSADMFGRTRTQNDYLDWLGGAVPYERWAMAHGASPNGWIGRPTHLHETQTHAFWCIGQAIEFLSKRDPSAPFFLNVSFIDPHPPFTPPQFFYDRYARSDLPKPVVGQWAPRFDAPSKGFDPEVKLGRGEGRMLRLDDETMHFCRAGYFGLINHIDTQIGRLLQYLRDNRLFDDTFILFASDHGEMLGDHNMLAKCRPFEQSARVPFLALAPRHFGFPGEIVIDSPVGLQDVMPTLLDAAGSVVPESVTGTSVLPLMRNEEADWRDFLHGEHAGQYRYEDGMHFLTDGRDKYIWYSQTGKEMLFDLIVDPSESKDLAGVESATSRLESWRSRLVAQLSHRPEGFVSSNSLVVGRPHDALVPEPL